MLLPEAAGPHDPAPTTPTRSAGSVRRTSSIDSSRPDGLGGDLVVVGRARDLRTDTTGSATVLAHAELRLRLEGRTRAILSVQSTPALDGIDALVGLAVGPGFRSRVNEALPEEEFSGSLLYLLLDDLPVRGSSRPGSDRRRPTRPTPARPTPARRQRLRRAGGGSP